jgi:site-specific DNA-methyltransferase (adenine-specific)
MPRNATVKKTSKADADRQATHAAGLAEMRKAAAKASKKSDVVGRITPRLYDDAGVPEANQIIQGDSADVLDAGPEGWVDLVFADPPFNIGYLYAGYKDQKPLDAYLDWTRRWMKSVHRALSPTGSFFLAIGDDYVADLCVIARRELGFELRNWIVWHYTFGQQPKQKFARSHTHILYFTKDAKNFTFNADAVRVKSARQTVYNDSRANKKGKLPDDTWYLRPQETGDELFNNGDDVWHESRVCGTFKEREGWHGCQMPIAVLDRIIKAASNPGDVVLDPFNGSGTTCLSAALQNRRYVGIELNNDYVSLARQRVADALVAAGDDADLSRVMSPDRQSKVQTATDALGRPRVARLARKRA